VLRPLGSPAAMSLLRLQATGFVPHSFEWFAFFELFFVISRIRKRIFPAGRSRATVFREIATMAFLPKKTSGYRMKQKHVPVAVKTGYQVRKQVLEIQMPKMYSRVPLSLQSVARSVVTLEW